MYTSKENIEIRTAALYIKKGDQFEDDTAEAMIKSNPVLKSVLTKKSK